MSKERCLPSWPSIRPSECPSGPPRHPVNRANPNECGLSRLMRDIGASEGSGGLMTGWTTRTFTTEEFTQYGFTVEIEPGEVPRAVCQRCGLEMSLRKNHS